MPSLRKDALVGALQYYDAQVDDARHTMFIARTAAAYGAHVANRARVTGLLREGERVVGAVVHDLEAGATIRRPGPAGGQRHRRVDRRDAGAGGRARPVPGARVSKGIHLVVPRDRIRRRLRAHPAHREVACCSSSRGAGTGSSAPPTPTGRWTRRTRPRPARGHRLPAGARQRGAAAAADPRRRRRRVRRAAAAAVRRVGVHVEAVPRARGGAPRAGAGRGGRRQVHDLPGDGQGRRRRGGARARRRQVPPSVTESVPLLGAEGFAAMWNAARTCSPSARRCTWRGSSTCCGRYGSLATEVLDARRGRPDAGRAARRAPDYLRAEVVYAASHEGARHLDDVLARRTRISIETFDRGVGAAEEAAGWWRRCWAGATEQVDAGGRALPQAGGGRAGEPDAARRRDGRLRPHGRARGRAAPLTAHRAPHDGTTAWGARCRRG